MRSKRAKQLSFASQDAEGRWAAEYEQGPCEPTCTDVRVTVRACCGTCGTIHQVEHRKTLDSPQAGMLYCDKLREGGTETETANGGEGYLDDPRTDLDMQLMYDEPTGKE